MQYNYINSKQVVLEAIDNFNIQSFEFLGRAPMWITNCLNDLSIYQVYVDKFCEIEFNNYRCKLPDQCKRIHGILINGHRTYFKDTVFDGYRKEITTPLNRPILTVGSTEGMNILVQSPTNSPENESLAVVGTSNGIYNPSGLYDNTTGKYVGGSAFDLPRFTENTIDTTSYTYTINNGWLHFDIEEGTVTISYASMPIDLDVDSKLYYPLIPDVEPLKEALRWYIMRILLYRGYVHPLFNLKENNPYLNPGMAYDKVKPKAQVKCNSMNLDRRKNLTNVMNSFIKQQDTSVNHSMNYGTNKNS